MNVVIATLTVHAIVFVNVIVTAIDTRIFAASIIVDSTFIGCEVLMQHADILWMKPFYGVDAIAGEEKLTMRERNKHFEEFN